MLLSIPSAYDRWQEPTSSVTEIAHVHVQPTDKTMLSATNDEVKLSGIIFVDAKYSTPAVDFEALQQAAQAAGGVLQCSIRTRRGTVIGPMNILDVEALPDDEANLHHWELGVA